MTKRDYILSHSGRMVSASQDSVPSESDIAISLSRQPRFAGMTRRWWSVLDHSLYVAKLAVLGNYPAKTVVAALLHDAHEFTGDIPTPFKTEQQRLMQRRMDEQIFAAYLPRASDYFPHADIKALDNRALLAEALVIGPPALKTYADVVAHFGGAPLVADVAVLREGIESGELGVAPGMIERGEFAPNAATFLWMLQQYRNLAMGGV